VREIGTESGSGSRNVTVRTEIRKGTRKEIDLTARIATVTATCGTRKGMNVGAGALTGSGAHRRHL